MGRAATLIAGTNEVGQFQKIVNSIGNFLVIISIGFVIVIILVDILVHHYAPLEALKQVVSIAIESQRLRA